MKNRVRFLAMTLILVLVVWLATNPDMVIAAAQAYVVQVTGAAGPGGRNYLSVFDEDNMASNSANGIATQQSIKAYVDSGSATLSNKTLASPTLTGTISATGTLTVNGGTADQDTIIYGNALTAVVYVDAGNKRVGFNDATPSTDVDVGGSVAVQGSLDVAKTLNADTLDVDGAADFALGLTSNGTGGNVARVLEMDYTQSGDTNTTWSGSSVTSPSGATVGAGIRVLCGGTITGANAAKTVYLMVGTGAGSTVLTLATPTTAIGDWVFDATIVFAGATTSKAFGELHVRDGATYVDVADYGEGSVSIASGATIDLQLKTASGSDTLTKEACTWEYLP